jgi:cystathionine beta-lyase
MVANKAALTEGADWLDQVLPYIDTNHDMVVNFMKAKLPQITVAKAQGTYLQWVDVTYVAEKIGAKAKAASMSTGRRQMSPEQVVQDWFAENAGIALNAGSGYGTGGQNHQRMNIATSKKTLQAALDAMAMAVNKL